MSISAQEFKNFEVKNPWSGEILGEVSYDSPRVIKRKIRELNDSPRLSAKDRISYLKDFGKYLNENSGYYADLIARESGVPKTHVNLRMKIISEKYKHIDDYARTVLGPEYGDNYMKLLDEEWVKDPHFPNGDYFIRKVPKGTYFLLAPNNDSPGITLISVMDLILGGNKVLVKPGTKMPFSTMEVIDKMKEVGLDGYISYVNGSGPEVTDVVLSSNIDAMFFVGTSRHGKKVQEKCIESGVDFIGEYEGNNYEFFLKDIEIPKAVSDFTLSTTLYNGIACYSIKGGSVEEEYEKFKEELIRQGEIINKSIGDPTKDSTLLGPILSEKLVKNSVRRVDEAVKNGGNIILGGEPMENPNTGEYNLMPYTVLENLSGKEELLFDETPGPVIWIEKDFKKALKWAKMNESKNPISSVPGRNGIRYVIYTKDIERAKRIGKEYRTGLIGLSGVGINPFQRWGGSGKSSTYDGFAFLLNESMDTQCLYEDKSLSDLLEKWHEMMNR
ncbi:MAG: aldehyde dehydrogenase [Candidatus Aenigmarchaeota archaeon]|nr:aldehyde dehydrogenase [Candidatus Aenigmarchaeota archaeon]